MAKRITILVTAVTSLTSLTKELEAIREQLKKAGLGSIAACDFDRALTSLRDILQTLTDEVARFRYLESEVDIE